MVGEVATDGHPTSKGRTLGRLLLGPMLAVMATRGVAPSQVFLWFFYPFYVSGYDQKYILTCQV